MFSSKFLLSTVNAALLAGSATAFTGTGTHITGWFFGCWRVKIPSSTLPRKTENLHVDLHSQLRKHFRKELLPGPFSKIRSQ
jgi:hypothetical protein